MKLIKSSKYYINRKNNWLLVELEFVEEARILHLIDVDNNSTRTVLPDNLKKYDWILINSHEL